MKLTVLNSGKNVVGDPFDNSLEIHEATINIALKHKPILQQF